MEQLRRVILTQKSHWKAVILSEKSLFGLGVCLLCGVLIGVLVLSIGVPQAPNIEAPLTQNSWRRTVLEKGEGQIRRHVYLFNWTNPQDYLIKNSTPNFCEVGPFVFEEERKVNVVQGGNDQVIYQRKRTWTFLEESSMTLDTNVTNFNIILGATVEIIRNVSKPLYQRVLDYLIENKESFVTTYSARQLLFDGYIDKTFQETESFIHPTASKFGWFLNDNASTDGVFELSSNGQLTSWRGKSGSAMFRPAAVAGGSSFTGERIFYFEPKYERTITLSKSENLQEGTEDEERFTGCDTCMTTCGDGTSDCIPQWLPFTLSLPHFLGRTPPPDVTGMLPDPIRHTPTIILDKLTKISLASNLTYQVNMKIAPLPWSETYLRNLKPVEIPMIWYSDTSRLAEENVNDIKLFRTAQTVKTVSEIVTIAATVLFVVNCVIVFVRYKKTLVNEDGGRDLLSRVEEVED